MDNMIVGYFDDLDEAKRTKQELLQSGFSDSQVEVISERDRAGKGTRAGKEDRSYWEDVKEFFGFASRDDQTYYEEAARRGTLLKVRAPEERVDLAAGIIERHNPMDLDVKAEDWKKDESWGKGQRFEGEGTIPVVEEDLEIGKRAVRRGAVRIHQYVSETPVEEEVTLKGERVDVQRRTPTGGTEISGDPFQERTIEVEEYGEEPVVAKKARVVEEIDVTKQDVTERERVSDTVKKTQVDIDRGRSKR